jgi:hypothetical protein
MPHSRTWRHDRELQLIVAIWILVVVDATRQGMTLPASELAARWPDQPVYGLLAFTVFAPPLLVAANHFLPLRGLWFEWPKRIIDRYFGHGAASRFWVRLRPLWLMSVGAFVLGCVGYVTSERIGAASGTSISGLFLGFGVGFLIGALLERSLTGGGRIE